MNKPSPFPLVPVVSRSPTPEECNPLVSGSARSNWRNQPGMARFICGISATPIAFDEAEIFFGKATRLTRVKLETKSASSNRGLILQAEEMKYPEYLFVVLYMISRHTHPPSPNR